MLSAASRMQVLPAPETPAQEMFLQAPPVSEIPVQAAPEQDAPEQEAPEQEAPEQEAPEQEAPEQEVPEQEAPQLVMVRREPPSEEMALQMAPSVTRVAVLRTPSKAYLNKHCGVRITGKDLHISYNRIHFARHHSKLFWTFTLHPSRIPGDTLFEKAYALAVVPVVVPSVMLAGSFVKVKRSFVKVKRALQALPNTTPADAAITPAGATPIDAAGTLAGATPVDAAATPAGATPAGAAVIPADVRIAGWEASRFTDGRGKSDYYKVQRVLMGSLLKGFALNESEIPSIDDAESPENKFNYYVASYMACFCSAAYSAVDNPSMLDEDNEWGGVLERALTRTTLADDKPRGLGYKIVYNNGDIVLAFKGTSFDFIRHSLGGALATLFMARLQTIVKDDDPLVRGFDEEDRQQFIGSTVLYVMASQAIANFPAVYACQNCKYHESNGGLMYKECETNDWKNCRDCPDCRMYRTRERRRLTWTTKCNICGGRWEKMHDAACQGCKNFMDGEFNPDVVYPTNDPFACWEPDGKPCFCGDCGKCDQCKVMRDCKKCSKRRVHWPWIQLRDCYTFASPRVGDTTFAKAFDRNQRLSFERIVAHRRSLESEWVESEPLRAEAKACFGQDTMEMLSQLDDRMRSDLTKPLVRDSLWKLLEDLTDKMQAISSLSLYSWPAYWRIANEFDPLTKLPFALPGYEEKEPLSETRGTWKRGSLLDYQHVGYEVCLLKDSNRPTIRPPATRQRALYGPYYGIFGTAEEGLGLDDIFEGYETVRIKGSIKAPQHVEEANQNQPQEATGFLNKILAKFRRRPDPSSHGIKEYNNGLLKAEEYFATYSTEVVGPDWFMEDWLDLEKIKEALLTIASRSARED
ncbi:unnamed protein product [Mortierella alpina]